MLPKTINEAELQGYTGIDASLDISLLEYGLAWVVNEHCNQDKNEYHFIYGIDWVENSEMSTVDCCTFDHGYMTFADFKDMLESWANEDSFFNSIDSNKAELLERFPVSVYDLMSYYGYENVFGSCYWEGFKIAEND